MSLVAFGVSPPMVDGPSCYYRVHRPAQLLASKHHTVVVGTKVGTPNIPAPLSVVPLGMGDDAQVMPDALVLHYAALADENGKVHIADVVRHVERARACGQRVFCDLDDDIWAVPDWNTYAAKVRHDAELAKDLLPAYTAVLCSTATLARVCREETGARTRVAPNLFDPERYARRDVTARQHDHGQVVVGWHGLVRTSGADVERIGALMAPVLDAYPEVSFRHVGAESFQDLADHAGLDRQRVSSHPGVPIRFLPDALDFDIGLVVRVEGRFNRSRTETKGVELAAAGIPVVAVTDIEGYQDTPFICEEDEFVDRIGKLLNPLERRRAGEVAYEWARLRAEDNRQAWPRTLVAGADPT